MTVRLYHDDSFLRQFRANVVAHATHRDRPSVVLDATAFYPEAGGQMADAGVLAGAPVRDVQVDDAGVVHHVLEGGSPEVGEAVEGAIDWPRRRVHMSLHTGQHMLSAALLEVGGAATVSARLGESACTIDLDRAGLSERQLADAEALANRVIDDDAPIRAWFPEPGELASLKLRREPKVDDHVRVIAIGDFDRSPCGGTHCARTGQVGAIRVVGAERYKGGTRVTFTAGKRTRDLLGAHADALAVLARQFTCAPTDVPAAVDKLRRELADGKEQLRAAQRRWAEALADRLLSGPGAEAPKSNDRPPAGAAGAGSVVAAVPGGDVDVLRALATKITAAGRDAVLAAPGPDGTPVMIARATGSTLDCGALLRSIAQACGGRGGGRAEHAEGKLPAGIDWPALVAASV